jgi:Rho GTPase-activating protein RGD1
LCTLHVLIETASFNEKLVVNNGQVVSPQPLKGSTVAPPPSVNQLVYQINNEKDFDEYILKNAGKAPLGKTELQYVKHHTQAAHQAQPTPPAAAPQERRTSMQFQNQPPPTFNVSQLEANHPPPSHPEPMSQPQTGYTNHAQLPPQLAQQPPPQMAPYGNAPYSQGPQQPYQQPSYPRGPAGQATAQQSSGVLYNNSQPPLNPVFGVTLEELFRRDGSPVPMVVYQCIQGVDLFGLEVEGIYRIPGTSSHIQQMKSLFDSGKFANDSFCFTVCLLNPIRYIPNRFPQSGSIPTRRQ